MAHCRQRARVFGHGVHPVGDIPGTELDQGQSCTMFCLPAFKFESKRKRIDWRLLHGIDIRNVIRDTDLDTLQDVVDTVAFGDLDAEDTRHLTELNFTKIFRLAQLMLEYLLYVEDNLASSNRSLAKKSSQLETELQATRLRCKELHIHYKHSRKELKTLKHTLQTMEVMAMMQQKERDRAAAQDPAPQLQPIYAAQEAGLMQEMGELREKLGAALAECNQLKNDREELQYQLRHLHDNLAQATGLKPTSSVHRLGGNKNLSPIRGPAPHRQYDPVLEERLSSVQRLLATSEEEKRMLGTRLEEAQHNLEQLASQLSSITDKYHRQLEEAKEENEKLRQALALVRGERDELLSKREAGHSTEGNPVTPSGGMSALLETIKRLEVQKSELNNQLVSMGRNQAVQQEVVGELKREGARLRADNDQLQRSYQGQLRGVNEQLLQVQQELLARGHDKEVLESRCQRAEQHVRELQGELMKIEEMKGGLQGAGGPTRQVVRQLQGTIDQLQQEVTNTKADNSRLVVQLASQEQLVKQLQENRMQLKAQDVDLGHDKELLLSQWEAEIQRLKRELHGRDLQLQQLQYQATPTDGDRDHYREVQEMASRLVLSQQDNDDLRRKLDQTLREVEDLRPRLRSLEEVSTVHVQVGSPSKPDTAIMRTWKDEEMEQLRARNIRLKEEVQSLRNELAEKRDKVARYAEANQVLQQQLNEARMTASQNSHHGQTNSQPTLVVNTQINNKAEANNRATTLCALEEVGATGWQRLPIPPSEAERDLWGTGVKNSITINSLKSLRPAELPGDHNGPSPGKALPPRPSPTPTLSIKSITTRDSCEEEVLDLPQGQQEPTSYGLPQPRLSEREPVSPRPPPRDFAQQGGGRAHVVVEQELEPAPLLYPTPIRTQLPLVVVRARSGRDMTDVQRQARHKLAAQQLSEEAAEINARPASDVAVLYEAVREDWDTPFALEPHEDHWVKKQVLPGVVGGDELRRAKKNYPTQELNLYREGRLPEIEEEVDEKLRDMGIDPQCGIVSDAEYIAVMQRLAEERMSWLEELPSEKKLDAEVLKVAFMYYLYKDNLPLPGGQHAEDLLKHEPGFQSHIDNGAQYSSVQNHQALDESLSFQTATQERQEGHHARLRHAMNGDNDDD